MDATCNPLQPHAEQMEALANAGSELRALLGEPVLSGWLEKKGGCTKVDEHGVSRPGPGHA